MTFQVSPGVVVREIDNTNPVPGVSTSSGGTIGDFTWGPADVPTRISSVKELENVFGRPSNANAPSFLTSASFLAYSNALEVVRIVGDGALNATSGGNGVLIKNDDAAETAVADGPLAARYPGSVANGVLVEICPAGSTLFSNWAYKNLFQGAPATSEYADERGAENDEVHVVVVDITGNISGNPGTVLERFEFLSQASNARSFNGTSAYYRDVLNRRSRFVRCLSDFPELVQAGETIESVVADNTDEGDFMNSVVTPAILSLELTGGSDGAALTNAEHEDGLEIFLDENVQINFLFAVPASVTAEAQSRAGKMIQIAETRKDTVALISPPIGITVNNAGDEVDDLLTFFEPIASTSYAFFDSSAVNVYDRFNDRFVWIPACGNIAGVMSRTETDFAPWVSPGGSTKGQFLNVARLAFNPNKAQRDEIYPNRINPIITVQGEGTYLFGDRTALSRASAFDRINVRRLFISLEKRLATAGRGKLFEFNDTFTRAQLRNEVDNLLRTVQADRGITEYRIVCDETNNPQEVQNQNRMVADISVRPNRSVNFVDLTIGANDSGVEFTEVENFNI